MKHKNKGNTLLCGAIDDLIEIIESKNWSSKEEILRDRPDADQVHSDGFYFFDINIHRTLILIEFEANGDASIVWAGNHQEYEAVFKNNKVVIKKWLTKQGWI
ncbi:type II toxin-antitoxin system HigB family toxin [Mucilaginibacter gotjawali]|uniref:Uncharacterized protein n=2 Tax=Mucilaginibacter gotjawali TaxID=1550579 RepID=A0A110B1S0_9SPHI|nr:type II toxin-antitoxin system HigB family toxin [Mucilaginibacter gotjawali]MBB3055659.1 mRNA interferase HigB [Mucilaginibacter gotjawali]BAU53055.1 hypothetical protein MgSA37_01222 [Mucilaginibacter gotjawali]